MYWVICNALSAALQADSVDVKLGMSQLCLFQDGRKRLRWGEQFQFLGWDYAFFSKHWNYSHRQWYHRCECEYVCLYSAHMNILHMISLSSCTSIAPAQASSITCPFSIAFIGHMSSVSSVCSLGVGCPYTYWFNLALGAFGSPPRKQAVRQEQR